MPRRRRWYGCSGPRQTLDGFVREFGVGALLEHKGDGRDERDWRDHALGLGEAGVGSVESPRDLAGEAEQAVEPEPTTGAQEIGRRWRAGSRALPPVVRSPLLTIDVPIYRVECLHEIERALFGWESRRRVDRRTGRSIALMPVEIMVAYSDALAPGRREQTLRVVRREIDRAKHRGFVRKLQALERASQPPAIRTTRSRSIWCEDPESRTEATLGVRSYLEATPVQVVEFVVAFLENFGGRKVINVLDLTAGSATVTDVVATHGGRTAERDLGPVRDRTHALDLRQVHRAAETGRKFDLVFIHPPSIGRPHPVDMNQGLVHGDLSRVHPDEWVAVVLGAIEGALPFLQHGHGLLSVLVPEGLRDHQRVLPLPGMADRIVERLPEGAYVVDRRQLRWGRRARQVSLGRTRVPSVHLLIAQETWP